MPGPIKRFLSIRRATEIFRCIRGTPQWLHVCLAYLRLTSIRFPFVFMTRRGSRVQLEDWDELTTVWHVFFSNEYTVPAGSRTILDLGANIGAFAVWAAEKYPAAQIYSVEPYPATFERLSENVRLNGLQQRVVCLQSAVSGRDGIARFDASDGKRSYCRTLLTDGDASPSVEVPSVCLRTLMDRCHLATLDCLKMDVEGAEYDILQSSTPETLQRIHLMTLEYHDSGKTDTLREHLQRAGFTQVRHVASGWSGLMSFEQVPRNLK